MQEQRREQNEGRVVEKRDRQIQIAISSRSVVEMKDESRETERREVQDERRARALFENHEQADEEIDEPDQVYVEIARVPVSESIQIVEVCVVETRLCRKRGTLDQVGQMSADARLFEIDLNFRCSWSIWSSLPSRLR